MPTAHIPERQRRLVVLTSVAFVVILTLGSWSINLIAGSPVNWFWLIAGTLFVTALWMLFLWVRLSD